MEQNPELIPPDRDTPDAPQSAFDPTDPHGYHAGEEHGHTILPMRVLLGVLIALLVFTALTVFASQLEIWISDVFAVELPQWVNVSVAMSIATVKGILVVLYFMQLRYDSGLNAIIFAFCLLTVGIFMSFSALDVFGRDEIYRIQAGEIVPGGSGGFADVPEGISVSEWSRTRPREDHHDGHHVEHELLVSSPERSVSMYGPLVFAAPPAPHAPEHPPEQGEQGPAQPQGEQGADQPAQGESQPEEPLTPAGG